GKRSSGVTSRSSKVGASADERVSNSDARSVAFSEVFRIHSRPLAVSSVPAAASGSIFNSSRRVWRRRIDPDGSMLANYGHGGRADVENPLLRAPRSVD